MNGPQSEFNPLGRRLGRVVTSTPSIDGQNPVSLPFVCAATLAAPFGAFMIVGVLTDMSIGRPSSTAALAFLFVPIWIALTAGVGAAVGCALGWIAGIRRRVGAFSRRIRTVGLAALALLTLGGGIGGFASVVAYEEHARPRVIHTEGYVVRLPIVPADTSAETTAAFTFDSLGTVDSWVEWNSELVSISHSEGWITLLDSDHHELTKTDLGSFDYVVRLEAIPFRVRFEERESIAVLATLRATGHRSMLLIYNPEGRLIYEELLERTKRRDGPSMWRLVERSQTGDILLVDVGTGFGMTAQ